MGVVADAVGDAVAGKSPNAASRRLKKRACYMGGVGRAPAPSTIWRRRGMRTAGLQA